MDIILKGNILKIGNKIIHLEPIPVVMGGWYYDRDNRKIVYSSERIQALYNATYKTYESCKAWTIIDLNHETNLVKDMQITN